MGNKMPIEYVTLYDDDDNELTVKVEYSSHPAQRGGLTDPSWPAYWEIDEITLNGAEFIPTPTQQQIINDKIEEAE